MARRSGDDLVSELNRYGLRFMRGTGDLGSEPQLSPVELMVALTDQPEARLRLALIPLLLVRPQLATSISAALARLDPPAQLTLKFFYTAAVFLQQIHAARLSPHISRIENLPDLFSSELGVAQSGTLEDRLHQLGRQHRARTGQFVNWVGTYQSGAAHLLRQLEQEALWQR